MYTKERLYAKGRLKKGIMNKTEQSYARYLEEQKALGIIEAYWFEALKFQVAEGACFYTPDFLVLRKNGEVELHEVKGSKSIFQDDARVKCKVVAAKYPFKLVVAYKRPQKNGGGWEFEEF